MGQCVRSESAKRSLNWLHSRNVTKNHLYWHESPYMFLNTMKIKIFNIFIFSFCESNNPPYNIFQSLWKQLVSMEPVKLWFYSLWANVSDQKSKEDYWADYIQGMGQKFQRFPPILTTKSTSSNIVKKSCLHHHVLKASSAHSLKRLCVIWTYSILKIYFAR